MQSVSRKHKLSDKSNAEAELIAADSASVMIPWTKLLVEARGCEIDRSALHQDNKSSALQEENGKKSSGERTQALNICCFFLTDQVKKGSAIIKRCPTDEMIGDCRTKPLQGKKFRMSCDSILGSEK